MIIPRQFCLLVICFAIAGCQAPRVDLLRTAPTQIEGSLSVEFKRRTKIYETGTAVFMMSNSTPHVVWYHGQEPEFAFYQVELLPAPPAAQEGVCGGDLNPPPVQSFPLAPGKGMEFRFSLDGSLRPEATFKVGVVFYESQSGTNGKLVWSRPITFRVGSVQ